MWEAENMYLFAIFSLSLPQEHQRHTLKRQHKQYDGNLYYLGRTSLDF